LFDIGADPLSQATVRRNRDDGTETIETKLPHPSEAALMGPSSTTSFFVTNEIDVSAQKQSCCELLAIPTQFAYCVGKNCRNLETN
jgi:hypothetical protein